MKTWLCVLAYSLPSMLHADSIWIEGEDANEKSVSKHGWYDNVRKEGFSGKEWVSHYNRDKAGIVGCKFEVKEEGGYVLWLRANPSHATMSYRLDDDDWAEIDLSKNKRGEMMVSQKPDHRSIAWIKVGIVKLSPGEHWVRFRMNSKIANHGGIDCLCLTNDGFVPSGTMKPGVSATAKEKLAGPEDAIWIEGEHPTKTGAFKHGWYDNVRKDLMSGQDWLSHYHRDKEGDTTYEFEALEAGNYAFWWRGNVLLAKVLYSIDHGPLTEMDLKTDKRGEAMISPKPDHRSLAWVKVGKLALKPGKHSITFKFMSKIAHHGGIDCFCFVKIPFVPSGARKPTVMEEVAAAPGDWFQAFFDDDAFSERSVIDISHLVEAPAGKYGFLKRDGRHLKFENSEQPTKFWGCGANISAQLSREKQILRIRYLRKHGINMVRQHSVFGFLGHLENGELNKRKLDQFDWWSGKLKEHGIYMTWSVFYPLMISEDDGYDPELFAELEGRGGLKSTSGLVNIEPKLQELQWRYVQKLLTHKNPYTGLRYVDDPALAVVEVHNEDCIFWHGPLNTLEAAQHQELNAKLPKHAARFRRQFCGWLMEQYGTDDALKKAWGFLRPGESLAKGEFPIFGAWELKADGPHRDRKEKKRAGDYIKFLTELQRGFYERREKQLRELGFRGVTVTTAWRAGGPAADPANLYCDAAMDMIDRHNYFGGGAGGHGIKAGKVNNGSHLDRPGSGILSTGMYQVEDRPFAITEWTVLPPNQWKLEIAPLFAFYGMGLQGWDSSYHFLNARTRLGEGWPNLSSYVTDTPHYIGQFPAIAFALYNGHIQEAPLAAARRLREEDLYLGVDPLSQDFTGGGYDAKELQGNLATPPEALAVGRVTVSFDGKRSEKVDLSKYWDEGRKVVRSMTGELEWDYEKQVVTLRAAKTQAIVGRAGGHSFDLPGVTVKVKTPFVSIIFTPLDNESLEVSKHILITALAQDKQTGTQYNEDGTELLAIGGPPLLLEPVQATIQLKGAKPAEVNVLDVYGVPTGKKVKLDDTGFTIDGTYRTYYYEVKR